MKFNETYKKIRESGKTKNFLGFLIFVIIAAFFWVFMVLNDPQQKTFEVKVMVDDKPDSITFIQNPPQYFHITLRDKGFNLLRNSYMRNKTLHLSFREFGHGNRFYVSQQDIAGLLKNLFGTESALTTFSPDSISVKFTDSPGEKLPIIAKYKIECKPGMTLSGPPILSEDSALLYSIEPIDSIHQVLTQRILLKDVDKPTMVTIPLVQPAGARVLPDRIKVTFDVEQLVKKTVDVAVKADYIPTGQDILFFPSRIKVAYYVPMNHYYDNDNELEVTASFSEAVKSSTDKVSVKITRQSSYMTNIELMTDSVEYTLVRGN